MTRARLLSSRFLGMGFALAFTAVSASAQDPPPAEPSPSPEPPHVDVNAFVDTYYGYNLNKTDPTSMRAFDIQHNAFSLSLAEINFTKGVTADSRVGFRADIDFGKTADIVGSFEPAGSDGKEIYKHIQQAYVSLLTGKVQWDAGKFVTIHGSEVIESQDNWNYTRSVLFGYAIPFYHVGVRATVPVNDKFSLAGLVVNGWNNSSKIYGGVPCLAVQATWKPSGKVTWLANYMAGQEVPDPADTRHLIDSTLTLTVSPKLSLMANADYGKEGAIKWWGIAGYAKYQAQPNWALVGRYEYLDDTKGGFMLMGTTGQEVTLTSDHLVAGGLKMRLEYRTDFADAAIFPKDDGSKKKSQTTFTVGLVYAFAGKI
jgi:Putative beta-barrel porin-2, OmpL-like. bbp2